MTVEEITERLNTAGLERNDAMNGAAGYWLSSLKDDIDLVTCFEELFGRRPTHYDLRNTVNQGQPPIWVVRIGPLRMLADLSPKEQQQFLLR